MADNARLVDPEPEDINVPGTPVAESPSAAERQKPIVKYLIKTLNPEYTGKVFGIPINHGVGVLEPASLDPTWVGRYDDVVASLKDMAGYTLVPVDDGSYGDIALSRMAVELREAVIREKAKLIAQQELAAEATRQEQLKKLDQ